MQPSCGSNFIQNRCWIISYIYGLWLRKLIVRWTKQQNKPVRVKFSVGDVPNMMIKIRIRFSILGILYLKTQPCQYSFYIVTRSNSKQPTNFKQPQNFSYEIHKCIAYALWELINISNLCFSLYLYFNSYFLSFRFYFIDVHPTHYHIILFLSHTKVYKRAIYIKYLPINNLCFKFKD